MRKGFYLFLLILIFTTFVCGLVYLTSQQILRQSANDPQIQMAEDAAAGLTVNEMPQIVFINKVDVGASLSPFLIIYDDKGVPIQSSGELHGKIPIPPTGVFDYTRKNLEDRITWQPESGVRIAAVVMYFNGQNSKGFVLAGRSLKEVEKREDSLMRQVGLAWALMTIVGFGFVEFRERLRKKI